MALLVGHTGWQSKFQEPERAFREECQVLAIGRWAGKLGSGEIRGTMYGWSSESVLRMLRKGRKREGKRKERYHVAYIYLFPQRRGWKAATPTHR